MIDYGVLLQASLTLSGFLIGINAFLPKDLEEEYFAFVLFLIPNPVLFLVSSILAAIESPFAISFFIGSITVLILLFVGLGVWSSWEKYSEHKIKQLVRQYNPRLYTVLTKSIPS